MQESSGLGEQRNWSLSWRSALDVDSTIEQVVREVASPSSFRNSLGHYLDEAHVPQQAEPWFRKSTLSSADELMFSQNSEMPF